MAGHLRAGSTCSAIRPASNPLPTFFAQLVGITDAGRRATATARVVAGNSANCMRPWAVVDRWNELGAGGPAPCDAPDDRLFDRAGQNDPPQENDVYITAMTTAAAPATRLPADYGTATRSSTGQPRQGDPLRLVLDAR